MPPITDHDVAEAMQQLGGGFAAQLGKAWMYGDAVNQAKIKAVWPELWGEYYRLVALHRERTSA